MSFYTKPPRYADISAELASVEKQYPFVQKFSAGKSLCGREIEYIKVGAGLSGETLFAGGVHAQEWLTILLLIRFLNELCEKIAGGGSYGDTLLRRLSDRALLILPVVNPDGTEVALFGTENAPDYKKLLDTIGVDSYFSANARGVDLNHNFDAGWSTLKTMEISSGINGPAKKQYGGLFANSEPETQAIVKLLSSHDVKTLYAFHSQGEVIYYEYGKNTPPQSEYIVKLLCEASGYAPIKNEGLCSHGGMKDYFIQKFARPGFTVEIGKGENPLPLSDFADIYIKVRELLHIACVI